MLVNDTNRAIEFTESTTLMSLQYDLSPITPTWCEERTTFFSLAFANSVTREEHKCDRFAAEYNIYTEQQNTFLSEFRHLCAKVANTDLFQDDIDLLKSPLCSINLSSLNLVDDKTATLYNLLNSFTYWKCKNFADATPILKDLTEQQLAQHFQLLHLSMADVINSLKSGFHFIQQMSLRNAHNVEPLIHDCLTNSYPISDINIRGCKTKADIYICIIEVTHKKSLLIPTFQAVSYGNYHLAGEAIGFYEEKFGNIQCHNNHCNFFPFNSDCTSALMNENLFLTLSNCPFEQHNHLRDLIDTPSGILLQEKCEVNHFNDSFSAKLEFEPPILIKNNEKLQIKCEDKTYDYSDQLFTNLEVSDSSYNRFQINYLANHFWFRKNAEFIGIFGLYITLLLIISLTGVCFCTIRTKTYIEFKHNKRRIDKKQSYIKNKFFNDDTKFHNEKRRFH